MTQFNPIERIGVHEVALVFLKAFGWIEREQPISDFGIDMHVEIVQEGRPTGQMIALQIKSGKSFFEEKNNKIEELKNEIELLKSVSLNLPPECANG